MADLTEFSSLSWTESGQNLDRWGYPPFQFPESRPHRTATPKIARIVLVGYTLRNPQRVCLALLFPLSRNTPLMIFKLKGVGVYIF